MSTKVHAPAAVPATETVDKIVFPEKVLPPNKEASDKEMEVLAEEIKVLTKKMEQCDRDIQGKFDGTKGVRAKREEARKKLQVIRDERSNLMDQRKKLFDARDAFNKSLSDMKEASKKIHGEVKFKSIEDMDKAIERLEHRQSTSSVSISEEKKLIKEIESLKSHRRSLATFHKSAPNPDEKKEAVKSVLEQLSLLNPLLKEVNERHDAQMAIVKEFETVLDSAHKDEVPVLKKKKMEIKALIDQKYTETREIKAKFLAQSREYREYTNLVNKIKYDQRKAEREERDKFYSEQKRKKEEEEEKEKPWLMEIATCDLLLAYLRGLLPKKVSAAHVDERDEDAYPTSGTITLSDGTVVEVVTKKGDVHLSGPDGKKKTIRVKKSKNVKTSLSHGFDTISDFKRLNLTAPLQTTELEKSIAELVAKRAYFDTKPRGKRVTTPYGNGALLSKREDGMRIVQMDWVLAEGKKVIAYLGESSIRNESVKGWRDI